MNNIVRSIYSHSLDRPNDAALCCDATRLSYADLALVSRSIAAELARISVVGEQPRIGILGSRSIEAVVGVAGALWAGGFYIPIGLTLPEERILAVLGMVELSALIVDRRGLRLLTPRILEACPPLLIVPDEAAHSGIRARGDQKIVALTTLPDPGADHTPVEITADDLAYIEFTSGTTGVPKGVMVPARGVNHYVARMLEMFPVLPEDRAGEPCDLSFDLSVHNMFYTWAGGASLHIVPPNQIAPLKVIREQALTLWLSAPSVIAIAKRANMLAPGSLPSLRISFLCGEPLPATAALLWQDAAPNSKVVNIYGPTEATVACLVQPLESPPRITKERDVVAIGSPYPGLDAAILDEKLMFVPRGTPGEIALSGPQLALGYLKNPQLTEERFPTIDGRRWYLTGDHGVQDQDGVFHHLGRLDNQVKVLGARIELEEVEMHLRVAAGSEQAAVVAWPISHGSAQGLVGFVPDTGQTPYAVREAMKSLVASYMVPAAIHVLSQIPLSPNGKIDRKALLARLDQGQFAQQEMRVEAGSAGPLRSKPVVGEAQAATPL
jgi:amino acid adenylation domain-containing protein